MAPLLSPQRGVVPSLIQPLAIVLDSGATAVAGSYLPTSFDLHSLSTTLSSLVKPSLKLAATVLNLERFTQSFFVSEPVRMAQLLPQALKIPEVSRFINRANQLRSAKPAIAYWCKLVSLMFKIHTHTHRRIPCDQSDRQSSSP